MRLLRFLRGYVVLTVRGAAPQEVLNRLAALDVPFWAPVLTDAVTLRLCVYPRVLGTVRRAAEQSQCSVEQTEQRGFWAVFYGLRKRPVLLAGLVLAVVLAWGLTGRIWVLTVEGCESYHPQEILRALEELGVGVGTRGRGMNVQSLEIEMKLRLEKLEWFTINVTGARAVVTVRERRETPAVLDEAAVCNVLAAQTGLVTEVRVLAGVGLVQVGQVVEKGQLLIGGVQDHGLTTQVWHAQGEIFARTWRDSCVATPVSRWKKDSFGESKTRWGLVLGKKRFNFGQNSGISPGGYDKITDTWTLTLPGGVSLPLRLIRETVTPWTGTAVSVELQQVQGRLEALAEDSLLDQMSAGQIVNSRWSLGQTKGLLILTGKSECTEQIGRESPVEIRWIVSDGEDDGN